MTNNHPARYAVRLCHLVGLLALMTTAIEIKAESANDTNETKDVNDPTVAHNHTEHMQHSGHPRNTGHAGHADKAGFSFHVRQVTGYNHQSGPRGKDAISGENFQMMIYRGKFGPFSVEPHLMTTLEPWTLPPSGAPQLFQTGETWEDAPLVDRQHPHDLWMEITEKIFYNIGDDTSIFIAGGPVGSPALGPVPFMHRESARHLPWAPLGHHFQDSTHISMGILTAGIKFDIVEVEMSQFNGREPDENRKDIDKGKLDSWATRVQLHLGPQLTVQGSSGILKDPEKLEPGDQRRTTFSMHWKSGSGSGRFQHATSLIYGSTRAEEDLTSTPEALLLDSAGSGDSTPLKSWLLETDMTWGGGLWWMARIENLDRVGLNLRTDQDKTKEPVRNITAITGGAFFDIPGLSNDIVATGLGLDVTGHIISDAIAEDYGANPFGTHAFMMINAQW